MRNVRELNVSELQDESTRCESALGEAEQVAADLRARLGEVRTELAKRLRPAAEPKISDHALLRYIERILGVDVDAMRSEIMSDAVKSALRAGASGVTVNGVKMVAKDGVIVTVLSEDMRPKRQTLKRWHREQIDADWTEAYGAALSDESA